MSFVFRYEKVTGWLVAHSGGADKFTHTYVGLTIWLLALIATRRSASSLAPLGVVISAELANEGVDRLAHGSWMWWDTLGDMAATWCWPVVLTACFRWMPHMLIEKSRGTAMRRQKSPATIAASYLLPQMPAGEREDEDDAVVN